MRASSARSSSTPVRPMVLSRSSCGLFMVDRQNWNSHGESLDFAEGDVGVERRALEFQVPDAENFVHCNGFARERLRVHFVESDNGPFGHAWYERFQRYFGWLVDIQVQVEQGHYEVGVSLQIIGCRFTQIAL